MMKDQNIYQGNNFKNYHQSILWRNSYPGTLFFYRGTCKIRRELFYSLMSEEGGIGDFGSTVLLQFFLRFTGFKVLDERFFGFDRASGFQFWSIFVIGLR